MKYIYLFSITIMIVFSSGCAHKKPTVPVKKAKVLNHLDLSKIDYPNKIGTYELLQKMPLKSHKEGIMIRYVDTKKTKAYLDCYLYKKEQNSSIESQYKDLLEALTFMHKKGELKKFSKIYEDTKMLDKTHRAKRVVFDMENKNIAYYSVLYLATLGDHYFKVRISNPHKPEFLETDYALQSVKELFNTIKFNN